MDWQATDLTSAWRYAFMALVRQSPAHQDPASIAASVAEWNRLMRVADEQLAPHRCLDMVPASTPNPH